MCVPAIIKQYATTIFLLIGPVFFGQTLDEVEQEANQRYAHKDYLVSARLFAKAGGQASKSRSVYLYNSACSYALVGKKDSALCFLYKSIEAGWSNGNQLLDDEDLASLRGNPEWQKLLDYFNSLHQIRHNSYFWGMYFGFLFILFFYNFFLYVSLKETSYLWYSLSIFLLANFEYVRNYGFASEVGQVFFWMKYLNIRSGAGVFIIGLFMVFYLLFFRSFHNLGLIASRADKVVKWMVATFLFFSLLVLTTSLPMLPPVFVLILLAYLFTFGTGIYVWRKGFKPARYFLIGSIILIIAVHLSVLDQFGIIESTFRITVLGPDQLGSVIFYLFLSLALGDKVNILKKDKEEAQARALIVLEDKVQERTREVVKQKEDIECQKHLIEEKQKEILDSIRYAKRIQTVLLTSEKYIHKNISRLIKKS